MEDSGLYLTGRIVTELLVAGSARKNVQSGLGEKSYLETRSWNQDGPACLDAMEEPAKLLAISTKDITATLEKQASCFSQKPHN